MDTKKLVFLSYSRELSHDNMYDYYGEVLGLDCLDSHKGGSSKYWIHEIGKTNVATDVIWCHRPGFGKWIKSNELFTVPFLMSTSPISVNSNKYIKNYFIIFDLINNTMDRDRQHDATYHGYFRSPEAFAYLESTRLESALYVWLSDVMKEKTVIFNDIDLDVPAISLNIDSVLPT